MRWPLITEIRRPLGDHRRVRCFPLPKPLPREPGPVDLEGGGGPARAGGVRDERLTGLFRAQEGLKTGQEAPKRPPRRPTKAPRRQTTAPRRPRWPQDGPRGLQDGPRGPKQASQEGPKSLQLLIFHSVLRRFFPKRPKTAHKTAARAAHTGGQSQRGMRSSMSFPIPPPPPRPPFSSPSSSSSFSCSVSFAPLLRSQRHWSSSSSSSSSSHSSEYPSMPNNGSAPVSKSTTYVQHPPTPQKSRCRGASI